MIKIKVSETTKLQINWLVAKCEGPESYASAYLVDDELVYLDEAAESTWEPTTNWSQGRPIIEREGLWVRESAVASPAIAHLVTPDRKWFAYAKQYPAGCLNHCCYGETYLIAAMRCYVASKMGDEVEIPEELSCNT